MQVASDITVVIPTIPPRRAFLKRAMRSIETQRLHPASVITSRDDKRQGAATNRDAALAQVETPYVAFLDDDDEFGVRHLELLHECIDDSGVDLVYPWYTVVGGEDPFPQFFAEPWDNAKPHQTTVTFIAKTEALLAVGGFTGAMDDAPEFDDLGHKAGEDYRLILRLVEAGAEILHLPERTWFWYHHRSNTSGEPSRW